MSIGTAVNKNGWTCDSENTKYQSISAFLQMMQTAAGGESGGSVGESSNYLGPSKLS